MKGKMCVLERDRGGEGERERGRDVWEGRPFSPFNSCLSVVL